MLEKLFESLDENVFTAELKESLEVSFNEAVDTKATIIAEARIEEEIDSLNEKSEQHIEMLNEKAEEYVDMKKAEMVDSLDKYLDRIVEEFINESSDKLVRAEDVEKADMIIEAFEALLVSTGVKISDIVEAKDNSSIETKLDESIDKYDALVEENIALVEENNNLIKMGIISELTEGLTLIEAEQFEKLADLVEFTKDDSYLEKLETIKESVKGAAVPVVENNEEINEAKQEQKKEPVKSDFSHLI